MRFLLSTFRTVQHQVGGHFQRYRSYDPWTFVWRIAVEYLIVSTVVAWLSSRLRLPPMQRMPGNTNTLLLFALLGAPLYETVLFQVIPIAIARWLKAGFAGQVIGSTALFLAAHALDGFAHGLVAGLVGGFYFAFTYAWWRERSTWTAFWTTALAHAMVNAAVLLLALLWSQF